MELKDLFKDEIAQKTFGNNYSQPQYLCWKHRFEPDNFEPCVIPHTAIAEIIYCQSQQQKFKFNPASIGVTVQQVVQKISKTFRKEMTRDGISEDDLRGKPGNPFSEKEKPWKVAYKWLWEQKYSRWLWNRLKEKAVANRIWIDFRQNNHESIDKAKSMTGMLKKSFKGDRILPINQSLQMQIELKDSGKYLFLLNRGLNKQHQETRYLVCPSQAFAPNCEIVESFFSMPQQEAMLEDIQFDAPGQEEYIGILMDNKLELPWLNPIYYPVLEWSAKHLSELCEQLEKMDNNWQILYQCFEVSQSNQS